MPAAGSSISRSGAVLAFGVQGSRSTGRPPGVLVKYSEVHG